MTRRQPSVESRYWPKVDTSGGPDACWPWLGHRHPTGYGYFNYPRASTTKNYGPATRYAWELAHGTPVPDDLLVCHSCDNPSCVNPAHLFLGTHEDNRWDMSHKGRHQFQGRDTCKKGHDWSLSAKTRTTWNGQTYRVCEPCITEANARRNRARPRRTR